MKKTKKPGDMFNEMKEGKKHEKSEKKEEKKSKIKTTGKFQGKSNKLGGGGRFAQVVAAVKGKPGVTNPKAIAASIGRKKYGAKKMAAMAKAGKKKSKLAPGTATKKPGLGQWLNSKTRALNAKKMPLKPASQYSNGIGVGM